MPLILQPTYNDMTREQIEVHLLEVRARRMKAVVTYYAGKNAKVYASMAKHQERLGREYALLQRDIQKMEKLDEALEARLAKLEQIWQELETERDQIVEIKDGEDRDQEVRRSARDSGGRSGERHEGAPPGIVHTRYAPYEKGVHRKVR